MSPNSQSPTFRVQKIGIALAAYQPPIQVFEEQLASIQAQTFTNWICIITCDSPLAPLRSEPELAAYFQDPRFVWIENSVRLGHKKNFERAMQATLEHGVDAVGCSDQDDIWYPQKLTECARELERRGPLSLVHSDMHVLRDGKISSSTAWQIERRGIEYVSPEHLMIRNVVAGCSMLLDAELVRRYPEIPAAFEYHDHWYALVASAHGGVHPIAQPLFAYRQHGANTVGVTPFQRVFTMPKNATPNAILNKCLTGWKKSEALSAAADQANIPLPKGASWIFSNRYDLGLGVLLLGARHFFKDPPLARACFARSAGKALKLTFWK